MNRIAGGAWSEPGMTRAEIWTAMDRATAEDVDWQAGKLQGYVYAVGDDVKEVGEEAYRRFYSTSPLSLAAFPSLGQFSDDIIAITGSLLHANESAGTVTTGGTESNLLAVLAARQRRPDIPSPEMIIPYSAHPSFNKAGEYFGIRVNRIGLGDDLRAIPAEIEAAVTPNTILIVGSAPDYAHGLVDPISDLAAIAERHGVHMHVDSCVGGFFLPFVEKLGYPMPKWDFRVPGVSSISADLHKHGYSAKGASVLMVSNPDLIGYHEFDFDDWSAGRYRTATMSGTRAGGSVAAAWAVLQYLGEAGYLRIVEKTMEITHALIDGIEETPGLEVWGEPVMNKFGYGSKAFDIAAVTAGLRARGWAASLQKTPPAINMHVLPVHEQTVEPYLRDLRDVTHLVRTGKITADNVEAAYN